MNPTNKKPNGIKKPHVYKPSPPQKAVQAKMAPAVKGLGIKHPAAPPVYRPQAAAKAVQPKMANGGVNRTSPAAPPVYRPQPTPKVLQKKSSPLAKPPVGPLVNRPAVAKIVQPKILAKMAFAARLPNRYVIQRAEDPEWLPDAMDVSSSEDSGSDVDDEIDLATSPNVANWIAGVAEGFADGFDDGINDERLLLPGPVRPTLAIARGIVGAPTLAMIAAAQIVPMGEVVVPGEERNDGRVHGRALGYTAGSNEAFRYLAWARQNYPAIPAARRATALAYNGGQCVYCNAAASVEVDHVYPIQKHWVTLGYQGANLGQVNDANNLVGSCAACNGAKSNTYLNNWNGHTWAAGQWFPHGPPAGTIPARRGGAIALGAW